MRLGAVLSRELHHLVNSFKYSIAGLRLCFHDEVAFRQECMMAVIHFIALSLIPLTLGQRLYLTAVLIILLAMELLNTAIEAVTNLASPQFHPYAKKAKDCASAAVFCLLLLFFGSWGIVVVKIVRNVLA